MRSIIREPEFEESLRGLFGDPTEADAYTEAAEFILAVEPKAGIPARIGGSIWMLPMAPIDGQTVGLFYTFNEKTVWFLFLRASSDV